MIPATWMKAGCGSQGMRPSDRNARARSGLSLLQRLIVQTSLRFLWTSSDWNKWLRTLSHHGELVVVAGSLLSMIKCSRPFSLTSSSAQTPVFSDMKSARVVCSTVSRSSSGSRRRHVQPC